MEAVERDQTRNVYNLYGLQIISSYRFYFLPAGDSCPVSGMPPVELFYHLDTHPPFSMHIEEGELVYSSPEFNTEGKSQFAFYRFIGFDLIRVTGVADFYLRSNSVDCHLFDPAGLEFTEVFFISTVVAFCLERLGIPVIHAAAVITRFGAAAFPGRSGTGKSTLAAAFLRAGMKLLSDDMLPIEEKGPEFWGRPGFPQINLWPHQQDFFLGGEKVRAPLPNP